MTTIAQLRKASLGLPEAEEGTHFGMVSFTVRGKGFASVSKDGKVRLNLPGNEIEAAVRAHPSGEALSRNGKPIGFAIPLADINGKDLNALVLAAWTHRAPRQLAESAKAAHDPSGGDLPTAIGKPATRALHLAGLTTLSKVAAHTEDELLEMHGVGPKAVRILKEALDERGIAGLR